ncbi:MAG: hypothetical protein VB108_01280 [Anaerolineaceae bacterium]|nr:hypothetical protein [Anaerolineaceae bacterium]
MKDQCSVCAQYDETLTAIEDALTEALGPWSDMDEVFVPDALRPSNKILSETIRQHKLLRLATTYRGGSTTAPQGQGE